MPDATDYTDEDDAFETILDRTPEEQQSEAFKILRDQNKALKKEARELRPYKKTALEAERNAAFKAAGLPDDLSATRQTALLAAAGANPDAEGIKAAAIELGFIAVDPASQPRAAAATDSQIAAQTQQGAGHTAPLPTIHEQIKAAEDARDWKTASRLKLSLLVPATNGLVTPA